MTEERNYFSETSVFKFAYCGGCMYDCIIVYNTDAPYCHLTNAPPEQYEIIQAEEAQKKWMERGGLI